MGGTSKPRSQIKGGGRVTMSQESQTVLMDLLMAFRNNKNNTSNDEISSHDRKLAQKRFVRQLIQEHELLHWKKETPSKIPPTTTTTVQRQTKGKTNTTNNNNNNNNNNGKARIEIVEAIFPKPSSSSNHKPSSSKAFQEGTKKLWVVSRSMSVTEFLKQASNKLRTKKKAVRAFCKISKTTTVDLVDDLSGLEDGAVVYITSQRAPSTTTSKEDAPEPVSVTVTMEDPLESVKVAYRKQYEYRQRQRRSQQCFAEPIVDEIQRERHSLARKELPAAAYKDRILETVQSNKVVVLCGATGCGKSTQVPQFLLEADAKPRFIVVTQPRRVAAISLAHRVAEEQGSPPPGDPGSSVGYMVRSDRKMDESTCRIVFLTVGILLRMLVSEANTPAADETKEGSSKFSIAKISHLIIDEVHERDVNTDFTLTLLRGLFFSSSSATTDHLKLILMSATASSDLFVRYFTPRTPNAKSPVVLEIPGRTFPVTVHWLSECERFASCTMTRSNLSNSSSTTSGTTETTTSSHLSPRAMDKIDNNFLVALIAKIVNSQKLPSSGTNKFRTNGAILVFLPGRGEIDSLCSSMRKSATILTHQNVCKILKLHSSVPKREQQIVFEPALEGTFKIVLATNIAETSVTIPDVSHVIDTCVVKESRYNPVSRIKELVTVWTSQASLKQRAGRAGRTSEGTCWRLCEKAFGLESLPSQTTPEMLRTPLDELVLQICLLYEHKRDATLEGGKVPPPGAQPWKFLSMTPSPPVTKESLTQACSHLLDVDALRVVDADSWSYRLTPLGYHLSKLPMDAKVGKVLMVGCILGCLDGALTIAASLSAPKSCFYAGSNPSRDHLIANGFGGPNWAGGTVKGDLIAVIAVHRAWKKHKSDSKKWEFCKHHGLDFATLREMDRLSKQFKDLLIEGGFLGSQNEWCNRASEDAHLTSCCLVAGLYPNIGSLIRPRKGGPKGGRFYTSDGDECLPQTNSFQRNRVLKASSAGKDAYVVYHSKHKSIGSTGHSKRPPPVLLNEVNFVSRFALLLFGGELTIESNAIIVDGWLKFKVGKDPEKGKSGTKEQAILIYALRRLLDTMILEHMESSSSLDEPQKDRHQSIIGILRKLLSEEG